ncbi:MAG: M28 family metallopeptidase [Blastocatellia bacterium]|nr:M28 family metallopeptidase [Blastocatellia bacterium]
MRNEQSSQQSFQRLLQKTVGIFLILSLHAALNPFHSILKAQNRSPRSNPTPVLKKSLSPQSSVLSPEAGDWEKLLLAQPNPERARETLRKLTAKPHLAGTPEDYETAVYVRDEMRKAGIKADLVEYYAWLPYPKSRLVQMVAPERFTCALTEPVLKEDKDSATRQAVPTYSAYSPSGDVTAEVVYANYGMPADYKELERLKIDVKGKIVLVRYGGGYRGVKAKVAEEHGAAGVLIYSDPKDDGFVRGDMYPRGPFRPDSAVQRGSINYIFQYPGDPLTPNQPATKDAARIKPEAAAPLPRIPCQPLSYKDAQPILGQIQGPNVPDAWQGGLPLAYHVGPGPAKVHLKLEMDYQIRKIWNVIGTLTGSTAPDEWVLLGNHRDAWVYGAVDPSSGTTAMLEVVRSFGEMLKKGWKPQRTIIFGSWDGEEFGLIGSTEWVEEHRAELLQKAVVYLNVDSAVTGTNFGGAAVPSLWVMLREAAKTVQEASSGQTLHDNWMARNKDAIEIKFYDMGGGSDFAPFLNHTGIPAADFSLGGPYGVYHSTYDSFTWMEKFGDPKFTSHATMARFWGLVALRFADSPAIPLNTSEYAHELLRHVWDIDKEFKFSREKPDLTTLVMAATQLVVKTEAFERAGDTPATLAARNRVRRQFERAFLDESGLPGRSWFRHVVYASGQYSGYGAEIFSGLRHSLKTNNAADAKRAAEQLTAALQRAAEMVSK